ncbi:MAG: hypothetical protein CMF77_03875 [Candidatus Marinimicrobia bacterium]|nr:hypothetical protein [Candidatus Neomarinimicrobiota bacterium]
MSLLEYALLSVSTLFTLINPIGISPLFLVLTERFNDAERKTIARKGTLTGAVTLTVFALLGTYIFTLYAITLDAFRIMGGIIFFRSGIRMLESIAHSNRACRNHYQTACENLNGTGKLHRRYHRAKAGAAG